MDSHVTLTGKKARGVSAFVVGVLMRQYLNAMLDPNKLRAFTAWCAEQQPAVGRPQPLILAIRKMLQLLPERSDLKGTLKEWELSSKEHRTLNRFCAAYNAQYNTVSAEGEKEAS